MGYPSFSNIRIQLIFPLLVIATAAFSPQYPIIEEHNLKCNISTHSQPLEHLLPIIGSAAWTTYPISDGSTNVTQEEFSDYNLGIHHVSPVTTHTVYTLLDGQSKAWEAIYREGSYRPGADIKGGFGFYLNGPAGEWQTKLSQASEVILGYAVLFEKDFDFVKGGKLPGFFGGEGDKALYCSGGRQKDRGSCFNLRLMWRADGKAEVYMYIPRLGSNLRRLAAIPDSHDNPDYGFSVGRGCHTFIPGNWSIISERVKLNDVEKENGEVELWIDGVSVLKVDGLVLRTSDKSVIQGLHFETFFGGSTPDWASPREQRAWFSSVSGTVIV